jgi:hypothetical protein
LAESNKWRAFIIDPSGVHSNTAQMRSVALPVYLLVTLSSTAAPVDFAREIQPILSENCYQCHGPDAKAREAKLRLDTKEGAYRTLDGVTVVKPGDTANSELIVRVFSDDKDDVMPPPKSNRNLTGAQRELLKRWVEEGAPWGEHWAFVAPKRPKVPGIADCESRIADWEKRDAGRGAEMRKRLLETKSWAQNPIDWFVLDRLLAEGLTPSPEATPEKLCRRLHLDLTGFPPTLEEVDAFVAESIRDPQSAIGNLVDRLLASPRYGERMVWDWLDAARYADTNGYQGDPTRAMWYWRDWAIKALNENMPFDRFTIEQLAGDLLPNPTQDQLIATGFHRNHMINGEGGRIAEESRVEYVMDRTETTATVWMGLTFNCCRCHDHKFDPLKQAEYYQLSAYFNSIDETGGNDAGGLAKPIISLATPEQEKKIAELKLKEEEAKKERDELEKQVRNEQSQWEQTLVGGNGGKVREPVWHLIVPDEMFSDRGTRLESTEDGAVLATGESPATDDYILTATTKFGAPTAFKLIAEPDDSFINKGPGRADNGNFVLTELTLLGAGKGVELAVVSADFEQGGWSARGVFDGDPKTGWAVMPSFGKSHILIFEAKSPVGYGGNEVALSFRLSFQYGRQHTLGRFKLYATADSPALLRPMPEHLRELLVKSSSDRSDAEQQEIAKYYLETNPQLAAAGRKREEARKAREAAEKAAPSTMVMRERAKPRDTFVLVKGSYDNPAEKVAHGVPAILPKLADDSPTNRLALAKWLTAPEHPLTARVTVNRLWQTFFGTGLVKTAEDFGVQGERPSHRELLDWLAVEFRESSWDVKKLARLIVTSATYRQSSKVAPGMADRDPENRLLSRGPRHRLQSWMLRDQALAVSGLLVEKLGGPPVNGYQPTGVWEDATFGQIKYKQDHGEALYRRSLYTFWRRIIGPTVFFDVAGRQNCAVRVGRTNTPLHALVTLNDVTYMEAARALAERMLKQGGSTDTARIAHGFRLCTARAPNEKELNILIEAIGTLRQQYAADPAAAKNFIANGESKPDPKLEATELAAHTGLASLLLNLDETLTNE